MTTEEPPSMGAGIFKKLLQKTFRNSDKLNSGLKEIINSLSEIQQSGNDISLVTNIFKRTLRAYHLDARDIMLPRMLMIAVSPSNTLADAIDQALISGHSRMPLLSEDDKEVLGIVHIKDTIALAQQKNTTGDENLTSLTLGELQDRNAKIVRPCNVIPEGRSVLKLLEDFQRGSSQLSVVIDEYGNVSGLVTAEDVLEALVGNLKDEHDLQESPPIVEEGNRYKVRGDATLDEFNQKLNTNIEAMDTQTISGWIILQMGKIPKPNDQFDHEALRFTIADTDGRSIKTILVDNVDTK